MNKWLEEKQNDYDNKKNNIIQEHENLLDKFKNELTCINENDVNSNDLENDYNNEINKIKKLQEKELED